MRDTYYNNGPIRSNHRSAYGNTEYRTTYSPAPSQRPVLTAPYVNRSTQVYRNTAIGSLCTFYHWRGNLSSKSKINL